MSEKPLINIQSISVRHGQQQILNDVSLTVRPHEVLVVIGPSGSGKSTLLRCINRLTPIDSGTISFNSRDCQEFPILALRQKIGMVFQKSAAFEGTVAENIAFGPNLQGTPLSEAQILNLMEQAALEPDLINRDATTLSGGQEQRLAIARALANQPEVLLLDEPTSALDPVATHQIERILLQLRNTNGLTLIWVSHSIPQARRVADRVLFLQGGRVIRWGATSALLDAEHGDPEVLAFAAGVGNVQADRSE